MPYWARPWPSGVGLAGALKDDPPAPGTRVIELGCGLALPSVVAARAGARVLATDGASDAVAFAAHVLALNEVEGDVACADWTEHGEALVERGPFDLVLAADVLYTQANVEAALRLFPRLVAPGGELRVADPNRAGAQGFLSAARAFFDARLRAAARTSRCIYCGREAVSRAGRWAYKGVAGAIRRESVAIFRLPKEAARCAFACEPSSPDLGGHAACACCWRSSAWPRFSPSCSAG